MVAPFLDKKVTKSYVRLPGTGIDKNARASFCNLARGSSLAASISVPTSLSPSNSNNENNRKRPGPAHQEEDNQQTKRPRCDTQNNLSTYHQDHRRSTTNSEEHRGIFYHLPDTSKAVVYHRLANYCRQRPNIFGSNFRATLSAILKRYNQNKKVPTLSTQCSRPSPALTTDPINHNRPSTSTLMCNSSNSDLNISNEPSTSRIVSVRPDVDPPIDDNPRRIYCFFDIEVGGIPSGRIIFELFNDKCPKTCGNFKALCNGEAGIGKTTQKSLHYLHVKFHCVVKDLMIQAGDFSAGNGTGGESIYGGQFEDENFELLHSKPFMLSMANHGKDTNGSQFFITTQPASDFNNKHVVFGRVVSGEEVVKEIENLPVDMNNCPLKTAIISNCGELVLQEEYKTAKKGDHKLKTLKKSSKRKKKCKKKKKKRKKKLSLSDAEEKKRKKLGRREKEKKKFEKKKKDENEKRNGSNVLAKKSGIRRTKNRKAAKKKQDNHYEGDKMKNKNVDLNMIKSTTSKKEISSESLKKENVMCKKRKNASSSSHESKQEQSSERPEQNSQEIAKKKKYNHYEGDKMKNKNLDLNMIKSGTSKREISPDSLNKENVMSKKRNKARSRSHDSRKEQPSAIDFDKQSYEQKRNRSKPGDQRKRSCDRSHCSRLRTNSNSPLRISECKSYSIRSDIEHNEQKNKHKRKKRKSYSESRSNIDKNCNRSRKSQSCSISKSCRSQNYRNSSNSTSKIDIDIKKFENKEYDQRLYSQSCSRSRSRSRSQRYRHRGRGNHKVRLSKSEANSRMYENYYHRRKSHSRSTERESKFQHGANNLKRSEIKKSCNNYSNSRSCSLIRKSRSRSSSLKLEQLHKNRTSQITEMYSRKPISFSENKNNSRRSCSKSSETECGDRRISKSFSRYRSYNISKTYRHIDNIRSQLRNSENKNGSRVLENEDYARKISVMKKLQGRSRCKTSRSRSSIRKSRTRSRSRSLEFEEYKTNRQSSSRNRYINEKSSGSPKRNDRVKTSCSKSFEKEVSHSRKSLSHIRYSPYNESQNHRFSDHKRSPVRDSKT